MKTFAALGFAGVLLLLFPLGAAASSEKAHYVDGTVPDLKKGTEGMTHADTPDEFVFEYKQGALKIPYKQITKLEFGLKSHMSVGYNPVLGIHPKKVRDYALTIVFQDGNGAAQTAVFELKKDRIFITLVNIQTRTDKDVDFENKKACEYARKSAPPGQMEMDCSKLAK